MRTRVPALKVGLSGDQVTSANYNPNFKRVTAYQAPLTVRFGAKVTF